MAGKRDTDMKKEHGKTVLRIGLLRMVLFAFWTALVKWVDVQPLGPNGRNVGLAAVNGRFHQLTGVHMTLYHITDWLGLAAILVGLFFAAVGLVQLIERKSLFQVDRGLLFLGLYYMAVLLAYGIFEAVPINYRPVLIDGAVEALFVSRTAISQGLRI